MLTRTVSAVALLLLVAGCANNAGTQAGGSPEVVSTAPSDVVDMPSLGASGAPAGSGAPGVSGTPGISVDPGAPGASGAKTITGTVLAGVEPNCLVMTVGGTSYQLVFDDPAMRSDAPVGRKVTLTGRAEPSMMSTCQQGIPFMVSAARPAG